MMFEWKMGFYICVVLFRGIKEILVKGDIIIIE